MGERRKRKGEKDGKKEVCRCKQDRTLKVVAQSSDQSGSRRGEARARSGLESSREAERASSWRREALSWQ